MCCQKFLLYNYPKLLKQITVSFCDSVCVFIQKKTQLVFFDNSIDSPHIKNYEKLYLNKN